MPLKEWKVNGTAKSSFAEPFSQVGMDETRSMRCAESMAGMTGWRRYAIEAA
jgi:hypothetical protein